MATLGPAAVVAVLGAMVRTLTTVPAACVSGIAIAVLSAAHSWVPSVLDRTCSQHLRSNVSPVP